MRKLNLALIFSTIILLGSCSRNPINQMFTEAKKNDNAFAVQVPGWLIRTAIGKAIKDETIEETITELEAAKSGIKGARVLVATKLSAAAYTDLNKRSNALEGQGFDNYLSFKSKDAKVNLYAKESKNRLKDLFFFANTAENSVVLFNIKTDISTADFQKIAKKVNEKKINEIKQP
jgi:hypothetical protein